MTGAWTCGHMVTERRISVCHEETYPDKGKKRSWKVQKALVSRGQGYAPDDHQYCADAHIIPRLMPELDRTRTRTRLGAGQGSGRPGHESVFDLSIHISSTALRVLTTTTDMVRSSVPQHHRGHGKGRRYLSGGRSAVITRV